MSREIDAAAAAAAPAPERPPEPVRLDEIAMPDDLPAWALRGARAHRVKILFIPGACVHPLGYVQSFASTAADRGDLVTLQGDLSCGDTAKNERNGAWRRWSYDLDKMEKRIDAVFRASGLGEPRDVIIIGYSQGAERAEALLARSPTKYTSAILIGSPNVPSLQNLKRARSVVLMAGTLDGHALTNIRNGLEPLKRARIPTTLISIPGARHGQMGSEPEKTMSEAFDFIESHL